MELAAVGADAGPTGRVHAVLRGFLLACLGLLPLCFGLKGCILEDSVGSGEVPHMSTLVVRGGP